MTTSEFTKILDVLIRQTMRREDTAARATRLQLIDEHKNMVAQREHLAANLATALEALDGEGTDK